MEADYGWGKCWFNQLFFMFGFLHFGRVIDWEKIIYKKIYFTLLFIFFVFATSVSVAYAEVKQKQKLVVYSSRMEDLIAPLLEQFEKLHPNIDVSVYYGSNSLVEKIKSEGRSSPADVVITQNIAMLQQLDEAKLLEALPKSITKGSTLVADDAGFVAVSYRVRMLAVRKGSPAEKITSMQELAEPKWRAKICIRDGLHPYNIALFGQLRALLGASATEQYLKNLKSNLVRRPQGNDRDQIKLVYNGGCEIAVVNSYYYGLVKTDLIDLETKVKPMLVSLTGAKLGAGVGANISGVGVMQTSQNKKSAEALVQFLLSKPAQTYFTEQNKEYPVLKGVKWDKDLARIGKFTADKNAMMHAYRYYPWVVNEILRIGFNN